MPTQIYIDDSGRVHVSYPCDTCSEWVHTDDHCGDTKPDGASEYMCSDCYGRKSQGTVCIDCDALRPTIDGSIQPDGWACSDCTHNRKVGQLYIHDWLIFVDDCSPLPGRIAIHKDVIDPKRITAADCSSPDPDDDISRFGPGTSAHTVGSEGEFVDMHLDVCDVWLLVDEGYVTWEGATKIFKTSPTVDKRIVIENMVEWLQSFRKDVVDTEDHDSLGELIEAGMDLLKGGAA